MQKLTIKAKGLFSYPNQISEVPNGSLIQADNVVIDREGVLEPRRGYNALPGTLGLLSTNRANQIFRFGDNVISHYGPLNVPNKLAFYAPEVITGGLQTSASNTITNLDTATGIYATQNITVATIEQSFTGNIALGSNQITNIVSTRGLYVGQLIGGLGVPAGTTITAISGSNPFTITMSANSTYTKNNSAFNATNSNILGFPVNTTVTNVTPTTVVLSNSSTETSRALIFTPGNVNLGSDDITYNINGLIDNQIVQFSSTNTLPAGLTAGVRYFIISATDTSFQVSLTSGGAAIDITSQGIGTHTLDAKSYIQFYGWVDYAGTFIQPTVTTKMRSVEANNNIYFTTFAGIKKLDNLTGTIVDSGAPKGLDGFAILNNEASGFMPNNTQVVYRVVWGYKDFNKNLILGVPGQRILISNSSGQTKDVDLNITVPDGVTTSYFYQVYRSGFSASANDEPNDELALIYEANPSAADITNKFVTFTDQNPESLRNGAALYTSPSQEGILQSNEPPPYAKDVTLFKGSVFYANTKTKQNLTLSILAASGQFTVFGATTNVGANTPTTIRNLNYTVTGTLAAGSNIVTAVSDVSSLYVGQTVSDTTNPAYIPAGTVITQIVNSNTITISNAATTASAGDTLTIGFTGLLIGQTISGTGISSGTTIIEVYSAFSSTGNITTASPTVINIPSTAAFKVGQPISGAGIDTNTTVAGIPSGTSITLSKNALATTVGITLNLETGLQISQAAIAAGTVTLTFKNGASGIEVDDTITIAGVTYTAKTVENISAKQFKVFAQGSPAQNISDTAQSLVKVMNRTTGPIPSTYAYYQSGFQDLPGKILFQERIFGGGVFYASANSASAGTAYSPNLPGPGGITVSSQNDEFSNGLYFSKTQQPEAVPLLNFTKVGSAHAAILRIIPLRDSLFVLKEDGVFRLAGESPSSFRVDLFDSTTQILSAESAVSLNNLIFMLSKYGIVTVSDTGVTVVSRAIEDKMLDLFEINLDKAKNLSFGISYESDRKYIFFCISASTDQYATQAYVYNTFTETWTRWGLSEICGMVHPTEDVLYLGNVTSNIMNIERKHRNYTDYMDSSFNIQLLGLTGDTTSGSQNITNIPVTSYFSIGQDISGIGIPVDAKIIAITSNSITINFAATATGTTSLLLDSGKTLVLDDLTNIEAGDVLFQTNKRYSIITVVNKDTGTVTVRDFINDWVLGDSSILKAFQSTVKYVPQTADNPGFIKQFREAALLFQVPYFNKLNIGFDTDLSSGVSNVPIFGLYGTSWGRFSWGEIPWGGTIKAEPIRTYVPQQKQRCSLLNVTLTHREAYAYYRLNGISFVHNTPSERVGI